MFFNIILKYFYHKYEFRSFEIATLTDQKLK
jgi:hypothetical protein